MFVMFVNSSGEYRTQNVREILIRASHSNYNSEEEKLVLMGVQSHWHYVIIQKRVLLLLLWRTAKKKEIPTKILANSVPRSLSRKY